jgi:hypothetical protein
MLPLKAVAAQERPYLSRIYVQLAILRGLLAGNGSAKMLPDGVTSAESITTRTSERSMSSKNCASESIPN